MTKKKLSNFTSISDV